METFLSEDNLTGINHEGLNPNIPLSYLTASSIMGDNVFNENNEHMGLIKDIMINVTDGSIKYYVIEFGGFLGIGAKYFAIPYYLLTVDEEKKAFIFKEKKEILENAPGFDLNHWPDTNAHIENVYDYWSFV